MQNRLLLLVILAALTMVGCYPKSPPVAVVPTQQPSSFYVFPYPKKSEIPPQPYPGYKLTGADILYLRWLIRFDKSLQQLQSESNHKPPFTQADATQLEKRWEDAHREFLKHKSPSASLGIWAAYDGMLGLNRRRFSDLSGHIVTPVAGNSGGQNIPDEFMQRIIQNSKEGINYCIDVVDITFPGALPIDIRSFRVK